MHGVITVTPLARMCIFSEPEQAFVRFSSEIISRVLNAR
jgi:hypothetical protein